MLSFQETEGVPFLPVCRREKHLFQSIPLQMKKDPRKKMKAHPEQEIYTTKDAVFCSVLYVFACVRQESPSSRQKNPTADCKSDRLSEKRKNILCPAGMQEFSYFFIRPAPAFHALPTCSPEV